MKVKCLNYDKELCKNSYCYFSDKENGIKLDYPEKEHDWVFYERKITESCTHREITNTLVVWYFLESMYHLIKEENEK